MVHNPYATIGEWRKADSAAYYANMRARLEFTRWLYRNGRVHNAPEQPATGQRASKVAS